MDWLRSKRFQYAAIAVLALVLVGVGYFAFWNYELRWRPKTITRNQAEITRILETSGWVSPGKAGPKVYMIAFRTCPDCQRFKGEEFPQLAAANVDTRVIMIARRDLNGRPQSTPAERATVAELWLNRSWPLLQRWESVAPQAWTAPGVPSADGDMARTAVVEAGRRLVDDLQPLLRQNGINLTYPTLVWWTKDGEMRACACDRPERYKYVARDLGA